MMWYLFKGTVYPARCIWLLRIRILIANIFLKISATPSFIKAFWMKLISAAEASRWTVPLRNFIASFFLLSIIEQESEGGAHL